jgi:hypothetical protein
VSVALKRRRVIFCQRPDKATFRSERAAWDEIEHLKVANPERDYYLMAPYRCSTHKGWHIGNAS